MKNSKQYAKAIGKLYRSLKKKHGKVKAVEFDDPVEAIVYAKCWALIRQLPGARRID